MRIAVFVSGRGSNLKAILDSPELKNLVSVDAVVSNKQDCHAFKIAESFSIPVFCIGKQEGCYSYQEILNLLNSSGISLVVLAGYLKMIPDFFVKSFRNRIINIHPALLPSFGGKGMYGLNVHKAVFESSAQVSGATVHFVDENYDSGKIIAQRCVDISGVKSAEEIAERVLKTEHQLLPFVIKKFAEGKVRIINSRVEVL
ncbi:MAG: phosphoribosylglycinamide formyltransferase [Ignavibacteriaceae bacterium]